MWAASFTQDLLGMPCVSGEALPANEERGLSVSEDGWGEQITSFLIAAALESQAEIVWCGPTLLLGNKWGNRGRLRSNGFTQGHLADQEQNQNWKLHPVLFSLHSSFSVCSFIHSLADSLRNMW